MPTTAIMLPISTPIIRANRLTPTATALPVTAPVIRVMIRAAVILVAIRVAAPRRHVDIKHEQCGICKIQINGE